MFLTAGHCTDGATTARVYFQQDAGANYDPETRAGPGVWLPEYCAKGTLGKTCATSDELYNYGFDDFAGFPNTKDVGLVILDQPIKLPEYGVLAAPGSLDALATRRGQAGDHLHLQRLRADREQPGARDLFPRAAHGPVDASRTWGTR